MSVDDPRADALIFTCSGPEDHDHAGRRRISLLARAQARYLVVGAAAAPWRIAPDVRGKPYFINAHGESGPALSMTHSGRLAVAAVCESGDLGIDLECHRPRDFSALAAQAFGPGEQAAVGRWGAARIYRIWTLREAFAKATGEGLSQLMDRTDRFAFDGQDAVWSTEMNGACWHFASSSIGPDQSLGVALRGAAPITLQDCRLPPEVLARQASARWRHSPA